MFWTPDRGKPSDDLQHSFNLAVEVKKLKQAQQTNFRLEIGELLRVRGQVKTSRQQREIMASTYCEWRGSEVFWGNFICSNQRILWGKKWNAIGLNDFSKTQNCNFFFLTDVSIRFTTFSKSSLSAIFTMHSNIYKHDRKWLHNIETWKAISRIMQAHRRVETVLFQGF